MAKAYQYDAAGYFAGEAEDYGLLPNNATYAAPTMRDGHIPRWNGTAWEQVENHKGKEGYVDGHPHTIKDYGPLPRGWSDTPPPPTLEDVRAAKIAEINRGFDAALTATLTMPSRQTPPSAVEIALALDDFKADDPDGWLFVRDTHTARRDEMLALAAGAGTTEAVQAIAVSYAV